MEFSRQEDWRGLPFPSPGDLPDQGIEPKPPVSLAVAGRLLTTVPGGKPTLTTFLRRRERNCYALTLKP